MTTGVAATGGQVGAGGAARTGGGARGGASLAQIVPLLEGHQFGLTVRISQAK